MPDIATLLSAGATPRQTAAGRSGEYSNATCEADYSAINRHWRAHLSRYTGVLQADAVACPRAGQRPDPGAGYNELFKPGRSPGAVTRALCWAHARRKFFVLADVATQVKRKPGLAPVVSPIALEAVTRIDRIFDIERGICGKTADERLAVRQELAAPLVAELEQWLREQRAALSRLTPVAKAINYMLGDWTAFTRFLADGRICLTNNAAERALRGIALGRKSWLFAGSDRGGQRAAFMYSLIVTAKLNNIDPQAWLADVLARIADIPQHRLAELLPWNWKPDTNIPLAQAA